jgi:CO/xanthine dehydrogenase FAD-binding subunit
MGCVEYAEPRSVEEVLALLDEQGEDAKILATANRCW